MTQRQQVAVGAAIFNHHGELLLVKRNSQDDFLPGVWEIPGGGTEFGEQPEEGLKREVKEECGIEIEVGQPVIVTDYYLERDGERVQRVEITYLCGLLGNSETIVLSDEHDSYVWKNLAKLDDLEITDYMLKIIEAVKTTYKSTTLPPILSIK
jgi:8-oxo-dGTP diphosphatase